MTADSASGATRPLVLIYSLGAQSVIDYTQEDFVDRPETYDVIIDILGKSSYARCRRILKPHGRMVFLSFKMKQILQMLWTSVIGDKKVICALVGRAARRPRLHQNTGGDGQAPFDR